eukprot:5552507-Amphidinium_carterae.1
MGSLLIGGKVPQNVCLEALVVSMHIVQLARGSTSGSERLSLRRLGRVIWVWLVDDCTHNLLHRNDLMWVTPKIWAQSNSRWWALVSVLDGEQKGDWGCARDGVCCSGCVF